MRAESMPDAVPGQESHAARKAQPRGTPVFTPPSRPTGPQKPRGDGWERRPSDRHSGAQRRGRRSADREGARGRLGPPPGELAGHDGGDGLERRPPVGTAARSAAGGAAPTGKEPQGRLGPPPGELAGHDGGDGLERRPPVGIAARSAAGGAAPPEKKRGDGLGPHRENWPPASARRRSDSRGYAVSPVTVRSAIKPNRTAHACTNTRAVCLTRVFSTPSA